MLLVHIIPSMWTVISGKKSRIPGLAILLLSVVLTACMIFAYQIERQKGTKYQIVLNEKISFSMRAGEVSFSVPSEWKQLSSAERGRGMILGWRVGLPGLQRPGSLYLDALNFQPRNKDQIYMAIDQYIPIDSLVLQPRVAISKTKSSLETLSVSLWYEGRDKAFSELRMIFLPDGSSLVFLMVGPINFSSVFSYWLDNIGESVLVSPREKSGKESPSWRKGKPLRS